MKKMFLLYITLFLLSSCCKVNYIDPPEVNSPTMDSLPYNLIWETPLFEDTLGSFSPQFPPMIVGDNVIFASRDYFYPDSENKDHVKAYNYLTGEVQWEWSDYKFSRKRQRGVPQILDDNILVINSGKEIYGINSLNGEVEFERVTIGNSSVVHVSRDILFYSEQYETEIDSSSIFMYDRYSNSWEKIFQVYKNGNYYEDLYPPNVEFNDNGDTLLYFQKRLGGDNPYWEGSELYCYNLTQDTILWKVSPIDSLVSSIGNPPLVDEKHVYFCSSHNAYCFDKYTGEKIWVLKMDHNQFLTSNYQLYNDVIFAAGDNAGLLGINKETGELKYNGSGAYQFFYNHPAYKHYILTCYDSIVINDADTGNLLAKWKTVRIPGQFNTGVVADERVNYMYVSDGFFLQCIEFPFE